MEHTGEAGRLVAKLVGGKVSQVQPDRLSHQSRDNCLIVIAGSRDVEEQSVSRQNVSAHSII